MENKIRTEEEILKDFEKLGWFVADGYIEFVLKKIEQGMPFEMHPSYCFIIINKEKHTYCVLDIINGVNYRYELSMSEHKLLNDLFVYWRWL